MPVQVGGRRAHVFAPNSCPVGVRWWRVLCTVASVVADVRMSGMGVVGTQGWVRHQWVRALVAAWIGELVMASVAVPGGALVTALVGALVTASIGASVITSATTFRYPLAHFGGYLWPNGLASVTGTAYTCELLIGT